MADALEKAQAEKAGKGRGASGPPWLADALEKAQAEKAGRGRGRRRAAMDGGRP